MISGLAAYLLGYRLGIVLPSGPGRTALIFLIGLAAATGWRIGLPRSSLAITTALILTGIAGGLGNQQTFPPDHLTRHLGKGPVSMEAWVAEEPVSFGKTLHIRIRAEWLEDEGSRRQVTGDCLLQIPQGRTLLYGQRLLLQGLLLYLPRGSANPGGFDLRTFLARQEIYVSGRLLKDGSMKVLPGPHPDSSFLKRHISSLRAKMLRTLSEALPGDKGAVLQAIVLGARERLSSEIRRHFRVTGTAHLLAISGLHVGFIAVSVFWAMRKLLRGVLIAAPEYWGVRFAPSRWAALWTAPAVFLYALLVGARVATVRATIMILVYLAARVCRATRNSFHALALAALLVLIWDPNAIGDVGFELSFAAVAAILLALRSMERREEGPLPSGERSWVNRLTRRAGISLFVSLVAFLATLPLIARTFHRVALIGPLANALVLPVASFAIPLGLASTLLTLIIPKAAWVLLAPAGWGASVLLWVLKKLAQTPYANIAVKAPSPAALFAYYGVLTSILLWPRSKRRGLLALATALLLLFSATAWAVRSQLASDRLAITFMDVGRCQAILLRLPDGRSLLWFGAPPGGRPEGALREVISTLLHQGINTLDGLIAANNTPATAEGLTSLARSIDVRKLFVALGTEESWSDPLNDSIERLGLAVQVLESEWQESCGEDCIIKALWPRPDYKPHSTRVVYSPMLHVKYKDKAVLLTGDNSFYVERKLVLEPGDLVATVLQVPKAGSRFSSSIPFVRSVAPVHSVIASRTPVSWREDVEKTLARYREHGAAIWRVDRDGAVTWYTDGQTDTIEAVRLNGGGFLRPRPVRAPDRARSR